MKKEMMRIIGTVIILVMVPSACADAIIIIDPTCTNLSEIQDGRIDGVKDNLHIAYQRTSHGSQLIDWHGGIT